jgi:hypothetical protein
MGEKNKEIGLTSQAVCNMSQPDLAFHLLAPRRPAGAASQVRIRSVGKCIAQISELSKRLSAPFWSDGVSGRRAYFGVVPREVEGLAAVAHVSAARLGRQAEHAAGKMAAPPLKRVQPWSNRARCDSDWFVHHV